MSQPTQLDDDEVKQLLREIRDELARQESTLEVHRRKTEETYKDYVQKSPGSKLQTLAIFFMLFVVIVAANWVSGRPTRANREELERLKFFEMLTQSPTAKQPHLARVVGPHWEQRYQERSGGRFFAGFPFERQINAEVAQVFTDLPVNSDEAYDQLSERERHFWDICWFEMEVMNGGIEQYLSNDSGNHAAETLAALDAIGAKRTFLLLKKACDLFPDGHPSPVQTTRQEQLEAIKKSKNITDSSGFEQLIDGNFDVDLYRRLLKYWHQSAPPQ